MVMYYSSNRKLIWEFTFQMGVIDNKQISISQQVHLWRDLWNSKWSLIYTFCFCNSACYLHDHIDHIVSGKWKLTTMLETEAYLTHHCPCSCNYQVPEILLNHACPCKGQAFCLPPPNCCSRVLTVPGLNWPINSQYCPLEPDVMHWL